MEKLLLWYFKYLVILCTPLNKWYSNLALFYPIAVNLHTEIPTSFNPQCRNAKDRGFSTLANKGTKKASSLRDLS